MQLRNVSCFHDYHLVTDTEVRDTTRTLPELETGTAVVLELDEIWHYLKNKSCEFGKLCVVIQENSSPGNVVIWIK